MKQKNAELDKQILASIRERNPDDIDEYLNNLTKPLRFKQLYDKIRACNKCKNCNHDIKSYPYGNLQSKILVLTDCIPNIDTSKTNIYYPLFDGEYSDIFQQYLDLLKVDKNIFMFSNCVNCYCSRYIESSNSYIYRKPNVNERTECLKYVDMLINIIKPKIIITMGSIASNALSKNTLKINLDHGKIFYYKNYPVFPTFSLSYFDDIAKDYDEEIINQYRCFLLTDLADALNYVKTECDYTLGLENLVCEFD